MEHGTFAKETNKRFTKYMGKNLQKEQGAKTYIRPLFPFSQFKRRKSTILDFVLDPFDACGEVGKIKGDRNNTRRHTKKKCTMD